MSDVQKTGNKLSTRSKIVAFEESLLKLADGDLVEGDGKEIVHIKWYKGVNTSYDLLTEDKGYRISGVPVDSMIPEMMQLVNFLGSEVM